MNLTTTTTTNIPVPVLAAARLTRRRFSGSNSLRKRVIDLILLAMGRPNKGTTSKTNSTPIGGVSEEKSTAASTNVGRSTAQCGHSLSKEESSITQDGLPHKAKSTIDASRTSHVRAGPSPRCNCAHGWLLQVETKKINNPEQGSFWYVEGLRLLFAVFGGRRSTCDCKGWPHLIAPPSAIRDAD